MGIYYPDLIQEGSWSVGYENLWDMVQKSENDFNTFLSGIEYTDDEGDIHSFAGMEGILQAYDPMQEQERRKQQGLSAMNRQNDVLTELSALNKLDTGFASPAGEIARARDKVIGNQMSASTQETAKARDDIMGYMQDWERRFKSDALAVLGLQYG